MRAFTIAAILLALGLTTSGAEPKMVIHEWGTFTNLQDESGKSVGGINSDDEPLPDFTHNLAGQWILGDALSQRHNLFQKGYPAARPEVTMRLETPVLYFHPDGGSWPTPVSVHVDFHGGLLTQFYPDAIASKPQDHISAEIVGHLDWQNLSIGSDKSGPKTTSHVWIAPRAVQAANITTPKGESERYLFYRGVGHVDAPLRLVNNGSMIEIHSQLDAAFAKSSSLDISRLWFCEFRADGQCAFRELKPVSISAGTDAILGLTPIGFGGDSFSTGNLSQLKNQMLATLVEQGLFEDEADALLNTWELSYFKSSGTRLFYIVPRAWTEHYLPLQTSVAGSLNRVMIGRIDLVTPAHRRLLRNIADDPDPKSNEAALWKAYEDLGRFRNALLLNERIRRDTKSLETFILFHDLGP